VMRKEVFQNAIEVIRDLRRYLDARHVYRASVRGFGRAIFLPVSRRSR
jgi:hypothetical protein